MQFSVSLRMNPKSRHDQLPVLSTGRMRCTGNLKFAAAPSSPYLSQAILCPWYRAVMGTVKGKFGGFGINLWETAGDEGMVR